MTLIAGSNAPANIKSSADVVCTGTADQVAVNNALAASPANDKTVWWGTLNLTGPITFTKSGSVFHGAGIGVSTLNRSNGFSGSAMLSCAGVSDACHEIDVGHFTVNGNNLGTQATTDGIYFSANRSVLHYVNIYSCNGAGIHVKDFSGGSSTYQSLVTRVVCGFNGNCGCWWEGTDSGLEKAEIFNNAGPGVFANAPMTKISGSYIWGNANQSVAGGSKLGAGVLAAAGLAYCPITGNKIEQNTSGGVNFGPPSAAGGTTITVTGNHFGGNANNFPAGDAWWQGLVAGWMSSGTAGTGADVWASTSSGTSPWGVTISGNTINPQQYGAPNAAAYGVLLTTGNFVSVHNNLVYAGSTGRALRTTTGVVDGLTGTTLSADNVGA